MVLFVQGIVMTLNSLIFLGVFLYSLGIILLFCYDYLNSKKNVKIAICIFSLLISFLPILFKNVFMFFMATAEILRLNGKEVFLISAVTEAAARKRDENKFVLGPVTLVLGIILSAILWEKLPAAIGIYALAFGDGLASLAGKLFGRIQIPFTEGKTVAGSLTCFSAIFISCYFACFFMFQGQTDITKVSLIIAGAGMLIEILPGYGF